ncbi:hypothetical protein ACSBR1_028348 [Camellia fascicularis]
MASLPFEIIELILSRLPIKSLIRFKCVSKYFLVLTNKPSFIKLHFNRSSQENPSLVLSTKAITDTTTTTHFRTQFYLTNSQLISCNKIHSSIPNFHEFHIMGSCNGLLCLVHRLDARSIFICNPCTGDLIKIPKFITVFERTHLANVVFGGFGFSPETNEYKVVVIIYDRGKLLYGDHIVKKFSRAFVYTLGGGSWRYVGVPPLGISGDSRLRAFLNGFLHWTTESIFNTIIRFNVANQVFEEIPRPAIGLQEDDHSLVVLGAFLAVIGFSIYNGIVVWIMTDHNVTDSWERSFTINFVSRYFNILMCYRFDFLFFLSKSSKSCPPSQVFFFTSKSPPGNFLTKLPLLYLSSKQLPRILQGTYPPSFHLL